METQCCGVVRQGMFNSWDRQPLLYTREPGGVLSIVPKTQQLRANFIFNANFNGRTNSGRRKTTPFGRRFVLNTYDRFAKTGSGQNRKTEAFFLSQAMLLTGMMPAPSTMRRVWKRLVLPFCSATKMPNVFQGRLGTNVGNVEKDVSSAGNVLVFGGFKLRCETVFANAAI